MSAADYINRGRSSGSSSGAAGYIERGRARGGGEGAAAYIERGRAADTSPAATAGESRAVEPEQADEDGFFSALGKITGGLTGYMPEEDLTGGEKTALYKTGVPLAIGAATAAATGGLPVLAQLAANVATGAGARKLVGEDPFSWLGLGLDATLPFAGSTIRALSRAGRAAPVRQTLPGMDEALDIKDWPDLPPVTVTNKPFTEVPDPEFSWLGKGKEIVGGPVSLGERAANEDVRTLASRVNLFPRVVERLDQRIQKVIDTDLHRTVGRRRVPLDDDELEDVTLILSGDLAPSAASPAAQQAATSVRGLYDDMRHLGEKWGVSTVTDDAGKLVQKPFVGEDDYFGPLIPKVSKPRAKNVNRILGPEAGGRRLATTYGRRSKFDPDFHETNQLILLNKWRERNLRPFSQTYTLGKPRLAPRGDLGPEARAAARGVTGEVRPTREAESFMGPMPPLVGPRPEAIPPSSLQEFGEVANELIGRASRTKGGLSGRDQLALRLLTESVRDIYQKPPETFWDEPARRGGRLMSTLLLPRTWARQFGQIAPTISKVGYENTVEGLARWNKDPDFRSLLEESGAMRSNMAMYLDEIGMGHDAFRQNPVGKSITGADTLMRGWLSAGHIPYIEKTLARAGKLSQAGEDLPLGLARQIREMGLDPGMAFPYQPTASTVRDAASQLIGRTQLLSSSEGQTSSALLRSPVARAIGSLRGYGLGAGRLLRDDTMAPIVEGLSAGLESGDYSDLGLGLGRLGRLLPTALAAEMGVDVLRSAQAGEKPRFIDQPWSLLESALNTNVGTPSELTSSLLRGRGPGGELLPPVYSILNPGGDRPMSLGDRALSTGLAVGSARYPWLSMASPAIKSWTGIR